MIDKPGDCYSRFSSVLRSLCPYIKLLPDDLYDVFSVQYCIVYGYELYGLAMDVTAHRASAYCVGQNFR